jgi:hypothetical protein
MLWTGAKGRALLAEITKAGFALVFDGRSYRVTVHERTEELSGIDIEDIDEEILVVLGNDRSILLQPEEAEANLRLEESGQVVILEQLIGEGNALQDRGSPQ